MPQRTHKKYESQVRCMINSSQLTDYVAGAHYCMYRVFAYLKDIERKFFKCECILD